MPRLLAGIVGLMLLFGACSSDDNSPDSVPSPSPTPDPFDVNLLSAIVLQPGDVSLPQGPRNGGANGGTSIYTASYGDPSFMIQSTVQRIPDPVTRDQEVLRMRQLFAGLIGNEETLALEGGDQAYSYASYLPEFPREAVMVTTGDFVIFIDMSSNQRSMVEQVHAAGVTLGEYSGKMIGRIQQALNEPPLITPVATFQSKTAEPSPVE